MPTLLDICVVVTEVKGWDLESNDEVNRHLARQENGRKMVGGSYSSYNTVYANRTGDADHQRYIDAASPRRYISCQRART